MKITRDQLDLMLSGLRHVAATAQFNADLHNIGKAPEHRISGIYCGSVQPKELIQSISMLPAVPEYVLVPKNHGDATFWTRYTVEGAGDFPWDMLRHDESFPDSVTDAGLMADITARRQVTLKHVGDRKWWTPTMARWNSFNWNVIGEVIQE